MFKLFIAIYHLPPTGWLTSFYNPPDSNELVKSKFYKKILQEKSIVESQLVFSLFANTNYYFDYEVKLNSFHNSMWRFYYHMLQEMVEDKKLHKMDSVSVEAYVAGKTKNSKKYIDNLVDTKLFVRGWN